MVYWNTARLVDVCINHGCFLATVVELSSCHGDHTATEPKILLFDPLGKGLPISILESMCIFLFIHICILKTPNILNKRTYRIKFSVYIQIQ